MISWIKRWIKNVLSIIRVVETVPELPLVVSDSVESVEKTVNVIKVLKEIEAYPAAEKAKDSVGIRPGVGKMRNRRYIARKGPLIVYGTEGAKLVKAFRNIPDVEVANFERLNLLKLALGGHLGRFILWTKSAFKKLDSIYGSFEDKSEKKSGYMLPMAKMVNADLARIINSDKVQSVVRPIKTEKKQACVKKNPLKNLNTMLRLNPYAKTAKRMAVIVEEQRLKSKKEKLDQKRQPISKEAMIKDTLERARELGLSFKGYLENAYVHLVFYNEDRWDGSDYGISDEESQKEPPLVATKLLHEQIHQQEAYEVNQHEPCWMVVASGGW